jgi:glycosyltransferase involved in cell wall biosynthesis
VIDPTSVASVAAAIERLFDVSAEARDDMGRRGRQMAIERFSAAVFQNRVLATIESACPFPSSRSVPLP